MTQGHDIFMLEMGEPIRVDDLARHMIRLRGLRPDVDIRIVHVGMRPGEKLHEELTFAGEARVPTSHPRIDRVTGGSGSSSRSPTNAAKALLRLALSGQRERLVRQLMLLVRQPTDQKASGLPRPTAAGSPASITRAARGRPTVVAH